MHLQMSLPRKNSCQLVNLQPSPSSELHAKAVSSFMRRESNKFRSRSLKVKNMHLDEQKRQYDELTPLQSAAQLRFLTDLLRKKKESVEIKIIPQPRQKKNSKDYQYYDMVVRDLISQIKTRKLKQPINTMTAKRQKPKYVSPIVKSSPRLDTKSPKKCKKQQVANNIKVLTNKQKMVFGLSHSGTDTVYERKITSYIEFLYKLNFSNGIYVDLSFTKPKQIYKVKVGHGNNALFVRSLIKRRFWLQITKGTDFQFSWTQSTDAGLHEEQTPSNEKQAKIKQKPAKRSKLLSNSNEQVLLKIMRNEEMAVTNEWYERSDYGRLSCFATVEAGRVSNHLPLNCIIGAKRILFKVMHWYYKQVLQIDPFIVLPKTYSFQNTQSFTNIKTFIQQQQSRKQIWIVKPGENTNRGNGIRVVHTPELITILTRQRSKGSECRPLIVQEYLKPFLYSGRKFDIRHYMLITSCNGFIRGYWYRDGYIRTSSEKYDVDDLGDDMIHLTNDAIQKKGQHYGKYETANKLSYTQFQRYLDTTFPHKHYSFETDILAKMKAICTDILRASFQFLDPKRKNHNFQLFGLDFFIDSKFKPYLIECNANPCLQINCPILERIIPGAVQHALRIGLDPLFPPPQHYPVSARYQLCDRVIDKLKYELIFDEKLEGPTLRKKIKKSQAVLDLSGIWLKPEEDEFEDEGEQLAEEVCLD